MISLSHSSFSSVPGFGKITPSFLALLWSKACYAQEMYKIKNKKLGKVDCPAPLPETSLPHPLLSLSPSPSRPWYHDGRCRDVIGWSCLGEARRKKNLFLTRSSTCHLPIRRSDEASSEKVWIRNRTFDLPISNSNTRQLSWRKVVWTGQLIVEGGR